MRSREGEIRTLAIDVQLNGKGALDGESAAQKSGQPLGQNHVCRSNERRGQRHKGEEMRSWGEEVKVVRKDDGQRIS